MTTPEFKYSTAKKRDPFRTYYRRGFRDCEKASIVKMKIRYRDGFRAGYARSMADHELGGKDFAREEFAKMKVTVSPG